LDTVFNQIFPNTFLSFYQDRTFIPRICMVS